MKLGMWMTSCPEAIGCDSWVFWKKAVSWDWRQDEASWDSNLGEASPVVCCGMRARLLGQWVETWRWTNIQHSENCVSLFLSSCRKPKSKDSNKSIVPEPRESSLFRVFSGFLYMWTFHVSVYLTYLYILRVRIMAMSHKKPKLRDPNILHDLLVDIHIYIPTSTRKTSSHEAIR